LRLLERIFLQIRVQALRAQDARERAALPPRARRRCGVRPLFQRRHIDRAFTILLSDLREDREKFYNYFRMTLEMFDQLLDIWREHLQLRARNCISPAEQLCHTKER
jgi:capsule polysaccharide export protein KpsE/RkpR